MSTAPQVGRQTKLSAKTRFHFLIEVETYDWLDAQARARGLSIAAVLNELLKKIRPNRPGTEAP